VKKFGALVLVSVLVLACGKRGDPRPPVPVIPQATSDLVVTQRADKVILSWSYPALTTAGRSLAEVRSISVYRYVEELPVPPGGRESTQLIPAQIDPDNPQPIAMFSRIPTVTQVQFVKLSKRIDSIEEANLASATEGAKLVYTDSPPLRSQDQRPVRLTYAVVTEGVTAKSEPSNLATLVPLPVAVAPQSVVAKAQPEGVVVTWAEPKQSVGGQGDPVVSGYNIYRTAPGEEISELSTPINTAPIKGAMYTDTPGYGEHEYRVAAVAMSGPPLLQSDLSGAARVTFKDLVPPPVPANLNALVETKLVRLLWDPVSAPDLAGYYVYRWEREARLKLCCPTPLAGENFTDISMQLGTTYRYEVTSVDKSGNESAPSKPAEVIIPKTP
jgi:hypothetical protein